MALRRSYGVNSGQCPTDVAPKIGQDNSNDVPLASWPWSAMAGVFYYSWSEAIRSVRWADGKAQKGHTWCLVFMEAGNGNFAGKGENVP